MLEAHKEDTFLQGIWMSKIIYSIVILIVKITTGFGI